MIKECEQMRKFEIIKLIVALIIGGFLGVFFIGKGIKQWRFNENNIVFCYMRNSWFYFMERCEEWACGEMKMKKGI